VLIDFSGCRLEEDSKARAIERARRIDAEAFENAPQQATAPTDRPEKDTRCELRYYMISMPSADRTYDSQGSRGQHGS
jgi:hypothetical protein